MGPRIRSIKPEISRSPDFTKLSNVGRVVFYALISQADDEGRLQGFDASHLAATYCAPGTSTTEVGEQLDLMENLDMIRRYGGRTRHLFTQVVHFLAHQKIDKPRPSRIPQPPSSKRRRFLTERSRTRRTGSDQIGRDQIASDPPPKRSPVGTADALVLVPPISMSETEQVFESWRLMWHPTAKLTRERRAKIDARLREGWSVEDLVEAATVGAAHDPWAERHIALNDDIKNLLRSGSVVEKFLELARAPLSQRLPASRSRAAELDKVYAEAQRTAREEGR